jgi:predicted N-acetyltransferase YhbS
MPPFRIRPLREGDIPAAQRIEAKITRSPETSTLGDHIRQQLRHGDPDACLVAERDGEVVGLIVGDIRPWEFGEAEPVGWIRVVGVDPKDQGQGVGRALGDALLAHFRRKGVRKVRTLVEWDAGDVISYFKALGFDRSDLVPLERGLD